MLPRMDRTLLLERDIVVADNIDQKIPRGIEEAIARGEMTRMVSPNSLAFPYRVMFNTIIYVTAGWVECSINLTPFHIQAPALVLSPSGVILDDIRYPVGTRSLIIAYTNDSYIATLSTPSAKVIRSATLSPVCIPLEQRRMDRYMRLFRIIQHTIGSPDNIFKRDIINGFTQVVSGGIAKILLEQKAAVGRAERDDVLLGQFIRLVQRHCRTERELAFYADCMHMTPKYLSRIISATAGKNASEIIRENVILEAKVLLRSGQYNVQEVSNALHFPNASFFGRYFRDATGLTPRQFALQR